MEEKENVEKEVVKKSKKRTSPAKTSAENASKKSNANVNAKTTEKPKNNEEETQKETSPADDLTNKQSAPSKEKKLNWLKTAGLWAGRFLDFVIIPFLVVVIAIIGSLLITKKSQGVSMIGNYAVVNIASSSMVDAGFEVGDFAFIKRNDVDAYKVGDYVAYFNCVDPLVKSPAEANASSAQPTKDPRSSGVVFHEIVKIEEDASGKKWFTTKGTNNDYNDPLFVNEIYVIGSYQPKLDGLANFIKFMLSITGTLIIVVLPCSIIIFKDIMELFSICYEIKDSKKTHKKLD